MLAIRFKKIFVKTLLSTIVLVGYIFILTLGMSTSVHLPNTAQITTCSTQEHNHDICVDDTEKHKNAWLGFISQKMQPLRKSISDLVPLLLFIPTVYLLIFLTRHIKSLIRKNEDVIPILQQLFSRGILNTKVY